MTAVTPTLLSLVIAFWPIAAAAQIYKWVDEEGVAHFAQRAPTGVRAERIDSSIASPAEEAPGEPSALDAPSLSEAPDAESRRLRVARQEEQCEELARFVVDADKESRAYLAPLARFSTLCAQRRYQCTTSRRDPKRNICVRAGLPGDLVIENITVDD